MKKQERVANGEINEIEQLKKNIQTYLIRFTEHSKQTPKRKGRPQLEEIYTLFNEKLNNLYQASYQYKDTILLKFYLSKKYDIHIVVQFDDNQKVLKIITYYYFNKRSRLRRRDK